MGSVKYTEYADEEHPCWNSAYSPVLDDNENGVSNLDDLIDWMFNQSRKGTINGAIDKEPLIQILNEAKSAKEENYSETAWNTLQADIEVAETALDANVNKADTDEASVEQSSVQEKQANNNTPFVVGVIIVIFAVVAGIVLFKRKK